MGIQLDLFGLRLFAVFVGGFFVDRPSGQFHGLVEGFQRFGHIFLSGIDAAQADPGLHIFRLFGDDGIEAGAGFRQVFGGGCRISVLERRTRHCASRRCVSMSSGLALISSW